jgi:hypothetical protein
MATECRQDSFDFGTVEGRAVVGPEQRGRDRPPGDRRARHLPRCCRRPTRRQRLVGAAPLACDRQLGLAMAMSSADKGGSRAAYGSKRHYATLSRDNTVRLWNLKRRRRDRPSGDRCVPHVPCRHSRRPTRRRRPGGPSALVRYCRLGWSATGHKGVPFDWRERRSSVRYRWLRAPDLNLLPTALKYKHHGMNDKKMSSGE